MGIAFSWRPLGLALAASVLAFPQLQAAAQPTSARARPLDAIIAEHWRWQLARDPLYASSLGSTEIDARIPDISLAAKDREAREAGELARRLRAINDASLSPSERTNKLILLHLLDEVIDSNQFGQRTILFTSYEGLHRAFARIGEQTGFRGIADYQAYLTRLSLFPKLNAQAIDLTRLSVAQGYAQPCVALKGFAGTITGAVAGPIESTTFYAPFARARPATVSAAQWSALQARARTLVAEAVAPEYRRFADYYVREYEPNCRKTVGISATPQGAAYYALQVRLHTTTDLTPDAIHKIGLSEVARISGRMDEIAKAAGYGSRGAMLDAMRADPRNYAATPDALLAASALMAKRIDGELPHWFGRLPRLPYGIRPIPSELAETTTTAYYGPGAPPSGIAGTYFVNTSKLGQRPLFEIPALTAHEAVPGHHLQIALQQELDLPEFRKYLAGFTAFVEGWGLYAEYLGEEMGLYDTPEKMMGRLSFEMWRACRLVVDTGIHSKGWSKDQAVAYMRAQTGLSDANIEAEVNRYISWPGQALGYKLGEMRIRALRARAETKLGERFDLRRFHDALLAQGPVPLDVLDSQIDAWIAAETKR